MLKVGSLYKPETHIGKLLFVERESSFHKAPAGSVNLSIIGNPFPVRYPWLKPWACPVRDESN